MMKNYSGKIAFAGAMVAIALLSRAIYPQLYSVATGDAGPRAASGTVPQFILPALSLATVSEPRQENGNGTSEVGSSSSPNSANPSGAGAVGGGLPLQSSLIGNAGFFVVPPGPVVDSAFSRSGGTPPPSLTVEAAVVADLSTGVSFMGENTAERWPLASITKLMTATIVLDKLSPVQKITITPDAFNIDPSERSLRIGDTYTVTDLLRFLLLPSSNVAAEALADAYGRTAFIDEMNARAAAWGMTDTHYADPSGLAVGSQSTAANLVLLAQKIYADYPGILKITRMPEATLTEIGTGTEVAVKNINEFSGEADFIGGKTGYTDQADGNLLSLFSYKGHPVVVIILGTDENVRFMNTEALYNWFIQNFRS